ncbi:hypothetical protein L484_011210 [Morus notabilis]|uniref:Uncharacterized protein n=1 Tax=Morus notabilis TaxID=981085 RepID=W9SYS7_9ROSA|nr:hypothetical protein L484_011210 [Morus notabilis]
MLSPIQTETVETAIWPNMGAKLGSRLSATLRRFDSRSAETAMKSKFIAWPTSIHWRGVRDQPVSFCHMEKSKRSISMTNMELDIKTSTWKDPARILKSELRWRSMVRAWRTVRLPWSAIGVLKDNAG